MVFRLACQPHVEQENVSQRNRYGRFSQLAMFFRERARCLWSSPDQVATSIH